MHSKKFKQEVTLRRKAVKALHDSGMNASQIAKALGIAVRTVWLSMDTPPKVPFGFTVTLDVMERNEQNARKLLNQRLGKSYIKVNSVVKN